MTKPPALLYGNLFRGIHGDYTSSLATPFGTYTSCGYLPATRARWERGAHTRSFLISNSCLLHSRPRATVSTLHTLKFGRFGGEGIANRGSLIWTSSRRRRGRFFKKKKKNYRIRNDHTTNFEFFRTFFFSFFFFHRIEIAGTIIVTARGIPHFTRGKLRRGHGHVD